jgi:hypothetical protein
MTEYAVLTCLVKGYLLFSVPYMDVASFTVLVTKAYPAFSLAQLLLVFSLISSASACRQGSWVEVDGSETLNIYEIC